MEKKLLMVSFRPFRFSPFRFHHANVILFLLLLPALVHGIHLYGLYAVRVAAMALFSCIVADVLLEKMFHRTTRIQDGSTLLAGLLLGLLFPPVIPWWVVVFSSVAAMFIGKQLFGGAGGSPFNAVCIGWAVAMVSWPGLVNPTYGSVGFNLPFSIEYPLAVLRRIGVDALAVFPVESLFLGKQAGCIGTGAPFLLLAGGVVGMLLGIIPWRIPCAFTCAMGITSMLFATTAAEALTLPLFHLLTGYSLVGMFFLAADFSSRPVTGLVMVWYGAVTGVLTVLFRMWSVFPEGLPFALLIANMTVPLFDRGEAPKGTAVEVVRL